MNDLKLIKKYYGENMMHLCRELFPTILDTEGKLFSIIDNYFSHNKDLYNDIIANDLVDEFKNFIYSDINDEKELIDVAKTPFELMSEAGYDLYECNTEKEIQKFEKYYAENELLCTFGSDRLKKCYVFFAVKKDVDLIKREDFSNPSREDRYGTSVISIQFTRGGFNTLSIKNRYNHRILNPDSTFNNNLENIIPGLTKSFQKKYNLRINCNKKDFPITEKNYCCSNDGKFYKYNIEINNIYFCPNNIIIDNGRVKYYDKARYIVADKYIFDLKNKIIKKYPTSYSFEESLSDSFQKSIGKVQILEINKINNNLKQIIINKDIIIELDRNNNIIGYINNKITTIENNFMADNISLKKIEINNVTHIKSRFLESNKELETIYIPNVTYIENNFLIYNNKIIEVNLPNINTIGSNFLRNNKNIKNVIIPKANFVGDDFLSGATNIEKFVMPRIKIVGDRFLRSNEKLENIYFPNLEYVGDSFLYSDKTNNQILFLPNLKVTYNCFLKNNSNFKWIILPKIKEVGIDFLYSQKNIHKFYAPRLKNVASGFLYLNEYIYDFYAPKIRNLSDYSIENILSNNSMIQNEINSLIKKKRFL